MEIKTKIKNLMKAQNISTYALAQASDLTQTCIANWYSKRNYEPSIKALEKVCCALHISMAQLFCKKDEEMICVDKELKGIFESWLMLNEEQRFVVKSVVHSYVSNDL